MSEIVGQTFGSWKVVSAKNSVIYNCVCLRCGEQHVVAKANIISKVACPTCPAEFSKSPVDDIIGVFGGMLGITDAKRKDINAAFEKLNQPEFKDVYASLERASASIKSVMGGKSGAPDVARKVLEAESANLKKSFDDLIKDGKISEEEARILKTDINSTANMQKLKSVLELMKQQASETKKAKV